MKISHFWSIFAGLQGGPLMPEISSSNNSSKINLYEGRIQKSATFDPPNPRSQNLARQAIFKASWKKCLFSMLGGQNRFLGDWGGPGRLFGLPWGFSPNRWGSRQTEISDQAHLLPSQNEQPKMPIFAFFSPKKSNF